jgi:hypothetical protein
MVPIKTALTPLIDSVRAAGSDNFDDRPPFMPNSKAQAECHAEYLDPEFVQAPVDRLATDQVEVLRTVSQAASRT